MYRVCIPNGYLWCVVETDNNGEDHIIATFDCDDSGYLAAQDFLSQLQ